MDRYIRDLVEISRLFGSDPAFVLAGGGNTSFKNEEKIWIKASGIALATIDENGFVSLSREKLRLISRKQYSEDPLLRENEVKTDLNDAVIAPKELRPSVETSLHDIIGYQYVVHTHPTKVNGLMCSLQAGENCKKIFGDKALFVPYTDPGYILFKKVSEEIQKYVGQKGYEPQIIFLENHGVFVGADTTDEITAIYDQLMLIINAKIQNNLPCPERGELRSSLMDNVESLHPGFKGFVAAGIKSKLITHFSRDSSSFARVCKSFTPDDIVYCKAHYLYIPFPENESLLPEKTRELIAGYYSGLGYLPKVLMIQGQGVIAIEESLKSAQTVLDVYENILKISFYSENFGGPKFLNEREIAFIDNWEVENYRRKVAKS